MAAAAAAASELGHGNASDCEPNASEGNMEKKESTERWTVERPTHTARPHSQFARALATRTHATHRNASHRNTNALTSLQAYSSTHPPTYPRQVHARTYRRRRFRVEIPMRLDRRLWWRHSAGTTICVRARRYVVAITRRPRQYHYYKILLCCTYLLLFIILLSFGM